jgi:high-affinity Fe2+/Pb2+ permease
MLNILESASDDQKALLGCLLALAAAGLVLTISYYLSPQRKQEQRTQRAELPASPAVAAARDRAA